MKNIPFIVLMVSNLWLSAEVSRVEITSRESVLAGKEFGLYGSYELIKGKIYFSINPRNDYNTRITDIALAKTGSTGLAETWTTIEVLKPIDTAKTAGVALVEVSNRGGKASMRYFNFAKKDKLDPQDPDSFGDGLIMELGMTVVWIGWQFDVPEDEGLKLNVPIAQNSDGSTIYGLVRSDWTVDEDTPSLYLGHDEMDAYPVAAPKHEANILTVRNGRDEVRRLIARNQWAFGKFLNGASLPSRKDIILDGGFKAGNIYELVYVAQDPAVVGLGHAAIRDIMSFIKYNPKCEFKAEKGMAVGISQTGRFLRQFVYDGFNTDEQGRKTYDGLLILTAGAGRGSFDHRFGQPSRDAHRYSAFFYPTDIFPFSGQTQKDKLTGLEDGLLKHQWESSHAPKMFYINTGYEYWSRAASLIHTSTDSEKDIELLSNERIYHIASGQHFVNSVPEQKSSETKTAYKGNPLNFFANFRALMVAMKEWVLEQKEPPFSTYPKISDGTLVNIASLSFEAIGDIQKPKVIHTAYRADYGHGWPEGIISYQPPRLNEQFIPKISQVDSLGNEIAGIRNHEIEVPLATYTPWFVRKNMAGGNGELVNFQGTFIPLSQKNDDQDLRPSIETLYKNKKEYLGKVKASTQLLIEKRYVLERDLDYVRDKASQLWDWIMKN